MEALPRSAPVAAGDTAMRSTQQQDMFLHQPTAADYLAAAETARRNPFETPEQAARRADYYTAMAAQLTNKGAT